MKMPEIDWHEYRGHIHFHTVHSDGSATFSDAVQSAAEAGLDFLIPTDHNHLILETDGWYGTVLVLPGQEVNDSTRDPEANHLLVLGTDSDVAGSAQDPQDLIASVTRLGGISFLAHPIERSSRFFPTMYPWVEMDVSGYAGIELWNFMSELKAYVSTKPIGLLLSLWPQMFIRGPWPEVLALWDRLCMERPVVAIGGSDNHGGSYRIGPLRRQVFPYTLAFRTVNTHVLLPSAFTGDHVPDRRLVYEALAKGHGWVGYDLLAPTEGFRFLSRSSTVAACMGDSTPLGDGMRLIARLPRRAKIRLLRNGKVVAQVHGSQLQHLGTEPGVYRIEAYLWRWGRWRGWIYSNPIYVRGHEVTRSNAGP